MICAVIPVGRIIEGRPEVSGGERANIEPYAAVAEHAITEQCVILRGCRRWLACRGQHHAPVGRGELSSARRTALNLWKGHRDSFLIQPNLQPKREQKRHRHAPSRQTYGKINAEALG